MIEKCYRKDDIQEYKLNNGNKIMNLPGDNCPGKFIVMRVYKCDYDFDKVIYMIDSGTIVEDFYIIGSIIYDEHSNSDMYNSVGTDNDGFTVRVNFNSENSQYVNSIENEIKEVAKIIIAEMLLD